MNKGITKKEYYDNNYILILMAIFVIFSWFFTRWLTVDKGIVSSFVIMGIAFNKVQTITILVYSIITILLIIIKVSPLYILLFSIFSIASTYPPIYLEHFNRNYYLTYYFTFGLAVINLIVINFKKGYKFCFKLIIPIIIILVYALFSIIWSNNLIYGANFLAVMAQGYLVYYLVNNLEEKVNYNSLAWFFSLLLVVIFLQYMTLINVRIFKYQGVTEYFKNNSLLIYFKTVIKGFDDKSHLSPLWANPNIVAGLIGLIFLPSLYKYFHKEKSWLVYLFIPMEFLFIGLIFLTMSSGLLFGYVLGIFLILTTLFLKDHKKVFIVFISLIGMFIIFVTTIVLLKPTYPNIFDFLNEFSTGRFNIYETAIRQLKDPITLFFGSGLGASKDHMSAFYYHSWIFNTLTNLGLIGFIITLYMIFKAFEITLTSKDVFAKFFLFGILVYLSHGIFDVSFDYQFIGVVYYGFLAIIETNNRKNSNREILIIKNSKTIIKRKNMDLI